MEQIYVALAKWQIKYLKFLINKNSKSGRFVWGLCKFFQLSVSGLLIDEKDMVKRFGNYLTITVLKIQYRISLNVNSNLMIILKVIQWFLNALNISSHSCNTNIVNQCKQLSLPSQFNRFLLHTFLSIFQIIYQKFFKTLFSVFLSTPDFFKCC